jgi:glutamyl-tRNA synthetase
MTIRRPDGSWIFHFVNVVDDIEMRISHVIRGEDHLSNTPKHIELYRAFGAEPPRFAHIPLILNLDGSKMSKRDVGASLNTYVEEGFLPEAVRNYILLLGWSPKDDRERMPLDEMISRFALENINRKAASFDLEKCTWLNGEYARELKGERFYAMAEQALTRAGYDPAAFSREYIHAALDTCVGKFRIFAELPPYCGFYFRDDFPYNEESVAKHFVAENKPRLEEVRAAFASAEPFDAANLEVTLKATAAKLGVKAGVLVHPTRLAVTGTSAGPSLYHLLEILGKEKVLARIDRGLAKIS